MAVANEAFSTEKISCTQTVSYDSTGGWASCKSGSCILRVSSHLSLALTRPWSVLPEKYLNVMHFRVDAPYSMLPYDTPLQVLRSSKKGAPYPSVHFHFPLLYSITVITAKH